MCVEKLAQKRRGYEMAGVVGMDLVSVEILPGEAARAELGPHGVAEAHHRKAVVAADQGRFRIMGNALHHLLARTRSALVEVGDFPRGDAQASLDRHGLPAIPVAKGVVAG